MSASLIDNKITSPSSDLDPIQQLCSDLKQQLNKCSQKDFLKHRIPQTLTPLSSCFITSVSEALEKMKGVYEQNPQMGDPSSLEPRILEMTKDMGRLRGELAKYEVIAHIHMHTQANTVLCFGAIFINISNLHVLDRRGSQKLWEERNLHFLSTTIQSMGKFKGNVRGDFQFA